MINGEFLGVDTWFFDTILRRLWGQLLAGYELVLIGGVWVNSGLMSLVCMYGMQVGFSTSLWLDPVCALLVGV